MYRIDARKDQHDKYQIFTGTFKTANIEEVKAHYQNFFRDVKDLEFCIMERKGGKWVAVWELAPNPFWVVSPDALKDINRVCISCGYTFTPIRISQVHHSNKCVQREAYKRRRDRGYYEKSKAVAS